LPIELPDHPSRAQADAAARDAAAAVSVPAISFPWPASANWARSVSGLALWLIFIDHLPPKSPDLVTIRNTGSATPLKFSFSSRATRRRSSTARDA